MIYKNDTDGCYSSDIVYLCFVCPDYVLAGFARLGTYPRRLVSVIRILLCRTNPRPHCRLRGKYDTFSF